MAHRARHDSQSASAHRPDGHGGRHSRGEPTCWGRTETEFVAALKRSNAHESRRNGPGFLGAISFSGLSVSKTVHPPGNPFLPRLVRAYDHFDHTMRRHRDPSSLIPLKPVELLILT